MAQAPMSVSIPANRIATVLFDGHSVLHNLSYHLLLTKA